MESLLTWLEIVRVVCYGVGVVLSLYMCIEIANLHYKALSGAFGTLSLLYGALLVSAAARFWGMGEAASRALITPSVVLQASALLILVYVERKGRGVWPFRRRT